MSGKISESQKYYQQKQSLQTTNEMNWIQDTYDRYCYFYNNHIEGMCKIVQTGTTKTKQWVNEDATDNSPSPPAPIEISPPPVTPPNLINYFKMNVNQTSATNILNPYTSMQSATPLQLSYTNEELVIHSIAAVE